MTPTRIQRTVPAGYLVVLATAALSNGCTKPAARTKPTPAADGVPAVASLASPAGTPAAPPDGRGAAAFAGDFLKAVNDGTATPAMLTPQFKRVVAEPVFESDRAVGHSEHSADAWLGQWKGKLAGAAAGPSFPGSETEAVGFAGVAGTDPAKRMRFALRVVNAGGWKVDWFVVTPDAGGKVMSLTPGPAGFAAVAFLDALMARDDRLAEALMTSALKARIAPPFDSDKAIGFNRGILSNRLADVRGPATGYAITSSDNQSVSAELTFAGSSKPVTLKFAPGERPWDWRVDAIGDK